MKLVIGKMKKRLDGMGMPGADTAPPQKKKAPADDAPDSLDDLFGGSDGAPAEGSDEEEAGESPDEEKAEGDDDSSDLAEVSDEDLLREFKKRGLSPAGGQKLGRMGRGQQNDT